VYDNWTITPATSIATAAYEARGSHSWKVALFPTLFEKRLMTNRQARNRPKQDKAHSRRVASIVDSTADTARHTTSAAIIPAMFLMASVLLSGNFSSGKIIALFW
jgi:hypothetical protein